MKLNWAEKMFINSPLRPIKQRQEARVMLELGGRVEGGRVLEIGCGRGVGIQIIFELFGPFYIEAFDFDPAQTLLAGKRLSSRYPDKVKIYCASAEQIPASDQSFDAVFDFGVLHHVPDSNKAIAEIARVLKGGGRFFFMEPLSSATMSPLARLLFQHQPELQFTREELLGKVAGAGLQIADESTVMGLTRVTGVARKSDN